MTRHNKLMYISLMNEIIQNIMGKVSFETNEYFSSFLTDCIKVSDDSSKSTYAIYENILFKMDAFQEGMSKYTNKVGGISKEKKFFLTIECLDVTLNELGLEIEKEDAFIIHHLRNLGKFKIREAKLRDQLNGLWGQYKEYALNDQDFSHTIKSLMRMGIIDYRKGNLSLKKNFIIRYRNP
jgi:hypothetical protein